MSARDDLDREVRAFGEQAERFCDVVDRAAELSRDEFLLRLEACLPQLYLAALALPDVPPSAGDVGSEPMEQKSWSETFAVVQRRLEPRTVYWTVFSPFEKDEPVAGHLADDVADIYRDLSEGLRLEARGAAPNDVIWTWRFGFQSHWGRHVVEALRAIHHLRHDGDLAPETGPNESGPGR